MSKRKYTRKQRTTPINYSDAVGAWVVFNYLAAQTDLPPVYAMGEIQEVRLYKGEWRFVVAPLREDGSISLDRPRKDVGLGAFVAKVVAGRHIPLNLSHEVQRVG